MQLTKNFVLQEFVSREIYQVWKEKSIQFLDFRIVDFAQLLRDNLGKKIVINNWHVGGIYNESGLRSFFTKTGATMSQHKFGRAIDPKLMDFKNKELFDSGKILRQEVQNNWEQYKNLITTTEADTTTWAHFDCRYTGIEDLLIVPIPAKKK